MSWHASQCWHGPSGWSTSSPVEGQKKEGWRVVSQLGGQRWVGAVVVLSHLDHRLFLSHGGRGVVSFTEYGRVCWWAVRAGLVSLI